MLELSLILIILLVLILPVTVHAVEKNLEAFLFLMGVLAVTFSHLWCGEKLWTAHLVTEALREPALISVAVLLFGLIVYAFNRPVTGAIAAAERRLGPRLFAFAIIVVLGLVSSVITAIIAAIILVEVVSVLKLPRHYETRLVVFGCFSIGLGAALTPIGEPLSTIVVAKLRGEPYHADFLFLLRLLGIYVIPGILAFGLIGALTSPEVKEGEGKGLIEREKETVRGVVLRAGKVYLFIMALIFLGTGFRPVIDRYIIQLPGYLLYWINTLSAVVDNATLAAAEISPRMSLPQIRDLLMGLLIAGGMLIPGNIPNIIAAGRLNIGSKEWARLGVPLGFLVMVVYFAIFLLV